MKQDSVQAPNCDDFRHVSSTAKFKRQDAPNWKASRPLVNSISPMSVVLFIIRALSFVCEVLLLLLAVATRLVKIIGVALTAYGGSGNKKVNSSKQGRDHLSHKEGTTNIHNMHKGIKAYPTPLLLQPTLLTTKFFVLLELKSTLVALTMVLRMPL